MLPDRPIKAATFAGGLGEDSWHLPKGCFPKDLLFSATGSHVLG